MKVLSRFACAAALLAALAPLTGCGDDDNNPIVPGSGQARVMAVHSAPGAPAVDVLVDGAVVAPGLAYPNNTGYIAVNAGTRNLKVNLTGTTTTVFESNLLVPANTNRTVFAANTVAAGVEAVVLSDDLTAPPAGQAKVRFVHLSPDAVPVDVAIEGGAVLFANTAFKGSKPFTTVAAGTYDLEVRPQGTTTVLLAIPSVTFEAGKIYTLFTRGLVAGSAGTALGSRVIVHN